MIVQEVGWGLDVDELFRQLVEEVIGGRLVDEDYGHPVDAVLVWWRAGDGSLSEVLRQARSALVVDGFVWVMIPKPGVRGHLDPADVEVAAAAVTVVHGARASGIELGRWIGIRLTFPLHPT